MELGYARVSTTHQDLDRQLDALVGAQGRVYRVVDDKGVIEPVPRWEDDAVHQLIDQKWLTLGGTHQCNCQAFSGPATSVLVPKKTRQTAARWQALVRPSTWGPVRTAPGQVT